MDLEDLKLKNSKGFAEIFLAENHVELELYVVLFDTKVCPPK